jgi:methylenetetrahydrofolate dehydrogenase (NADP+)/methenyltetrahydrofolate cyclohydrolase
MKVNRCAAVGIASRRVDLPTSTSAEHLVQVLGALSADVTRLRINKDYPYQAFADVGSVRGSASKPRCAEQRVPG